MRRLLSILVATCLFYTPAEAKSKKTSEIKYTVTIVQNVEGVAGVNRHGEMAGGKGDRGAFVDRKGQVAMFDCLQFDRPDERYTDPTGINNDGTVVGTCASGTFGFVRRKSGQLYQFSVPGADGTMPYGMNDWEEIIVEYYKPFQSWMNSGWYRFGSALRLTDGVYCDLKAPPHSDDVGAPHSLTRTLATAINNRRHIVGTYETIFTPSNEGGQYDSFLYSNGQYTNLPKDTVPIAINNHDQILMSTTSGFAIYDDGHVFKIANPPGYVWSAIWSLNDVGQLTGMVREDKQFPFKQFQAIATPTN